MSVYVASETKPAYLLVVVIKRSGYVASVHARSLLSFLRSFFFFEATTYIPLGNTGGQEEKGGKEEEGSNLM